MPAPDRHHVTWEHRHAELWDRIFQVTQDVVVVSRALPDGADDAVKRGLIDAAMAVGVHLVRANAADDAVEFRAELKEARLRAIETDYWLRMSYVVQQSEDIQRDLSSILTQYAVIVDLLQKFARHVETEHDVIARHTKGPRIS